MGTIRMLVAVTLALVANVTPAVAIDLTGTWTGRETCTYTSVGHPQRFRSSLTTVRITQTGTDLNVSFTGSLLSLVYNGFNYDHPERPSQARQGLILCNGTEALNATGDFKAKMRPADDTGTLKGTVIAVDGSTSYACKYKVTQISTADPVVSGVACP